jgi:anthranilate phosphoribosyltransferase
LTRPNYFTNQLENKALRIMRFAEKLQKLLEGQDLSAQEAREGLQQILSGDVTDSQIAAMLTALRIKGETVEEILGFAQHMREQAVQIRSKHPVVLDTCGTGGDGLNTFNISTLAALVVAGAGVPVAKHGNRAVSSKCGSADLLTQLGVRIDAPTAVAELSLKEIGFAFLFAPLFHPSMKRVAGVRKELGIRSIFNILGPLCNPAGADHQLLGVAQENVAEKMIEVSKKLPIKQVLVVCGRDGMDEVSLVDETIVHRLEGNKISRYRFRPEEIGLKRVKSDDLTGGDPKANAAIAKDILAGKPGPRRDAVLLNAAFGLVAAGRVTDPKEGFEIAATSLDRGDTKKKLDALITITQKAGL